MQTNVLIVNQHGDNRGDEAAVRGMLDGLAQRLPDAQFTIVHQFSDPKGSLDIDGRDIGWLPMRIRPTEAVRLGLHALGHLAKVPTRWLLTPTTRSIVDAYDQADVVISAPGGPYFGDLYRGHEPAHWFLVWLATVHERPVMLYAPSAGPFAFRPWNPFRRFTYRQFDLVTLREERSAEHLRALMGDAFPVHVTADSALQHQLPPPAAGSTYTIVVSALRSDPSGGIADRRPDDYDDSVLAAIDEAIERRPGARVVFIPQLHGTAHRDRPYLERLARRVPDGVETEVLAESADSNEHRHLIASSHLVIAGRYHPAVFAVAAGVPLVCIPYEHKAKGLLDQAGLPDVVVPIEELDPVRARRVAAYVLDHEEEIRQRLSEAGPQLMALSARTSELVAATLASIRSGRVGADRRRFPLRVARAAQPGPGAGEADRPEHD